MSRYIDRDAALKIIDNYAKATTEDAKVVVDAIRDIVGIITPTADVAEVRHGKWIFEHDIFNDPKGYFIRIVCSECHLKTGQVSNYCPKCGAKMDGERREQCEIG